MYIFLIYTYIYIYIYGAFFVKSATYCSKIVLNIEKSHKCSFKHKLSKHVNNCKIQDGESNMVDIKQKKGNKIKDSVSIHWIYFKICRRCMQDKASALMSYHTSFLSFLLSLNPFIYSKMEVNYHILSQKPYEI